MTSAQSPADNPRIAIYAGSFDPVTFGHLDMIERGARLFDKLIVAIGFNPEKRSLLSLETRMALLEDALSHLSNVEVLAFSGLLVDAAREHGAHVILRGLRPLGDFELEFRNGMANRDLSGLETVFLLSDPAHIVVSSSLVREIASHGGDVSRYVSEPVAHALRKAYGRS